LAVALHVRPPARPISCQPPGIAGQTGITGATAPAEPGWGAAAWHPQRWIATDEIAEPRGETAEDET
jgi:hypothetical protein